tara:strand:+ start:1319 stop:1690 length:372 start_codon:yes stop_codon:yes gene_type:complete
MIEVGRVVVKIAGRDARKKGVVVEVIDDTHVMIDGEVRNRKCNIKHLEPLDEKVDIKKGASSKEVCKALGVEFKESKKKEAKARPRKQRKRKNESGKTDANAGAKPKVKVSAGTDSSSGTPTK